MKMERVPTQLLRELKPAEIASISGAGYFPVIILENCSWYILNIECATEMEAVIVGYSHNPGPGEGIAAVTAIYVESGWWGGSGSG